jgi:hypothetical protein
LAIKRRILKSISANIPLRTHAVKARALRFDAHLSSQCDLPEKDQDWPEEVMNKFVAELDRLASASNA